MSNFIPLASHPKVAKRQIIVAASDDMVKRVFSRFRPQLHDGPVPVFGEMTGWQRTKAGPLGAVFVNPLTGRRSLWCLDLDTQKPRHLATLS